MKRGSTPSEKMQIKPQWVSPIHVSEWLKWKTIDSNKY
jgi:hypothetical protein